MPINFAKGRGASCMRVPRVCCASSIAPGTRSMTSEVKSERAGVLIAVLSSTFGGTAGAVTRYVVGSIDPVTIAAFRFGIGIAVLLPLALALRSALPRGRDWTGVALLGVMFFAVFFVFYNVALAYTTAARGALALSTLPLWTMVVAALLGAEA